MADDGAPPVASFKRILAAVDHGPGWEQGLLTAHRLAFDLGADLVVLHVVTQDEEEATKAAFAPEAPLDKVIQTARQELVRSMAGVLPDDSVAVLARVRAGEAATEILQCAVDRECDLIVITTRNRSRVGKLVFGSETQSVVLQAGQPVLSVRYEG
ncbi:universal stress protein [bacterium]|nr:universal stress protein [bacterium]